MIEPGRSSVYDRRPADQFGYRPPAPRPPSPAGRVVWIVFCLAWAGFWVLFGWFVPGFNILLAVGSVLAILLPVGKD